MAWQQEQAGASAGTEQSSGGLPNFMLAAARLRGGDQLPSSSPGGSPDEIQHLHAQSQSGSRLESCPCSPSASEDAWPHPVRDPESVESNGNGQGAASQVRSCCRQAAERWRRHGGRPSAHPHANLMLHVVAESEHDHRSRRNKREHCSAAERMQGCKETAALAGAEAEKACDKKQQGKRHGTWLFDCLKGNVQGHGVLI